MGLANEKHERAKQLAAARWDDSAEPFWKGIREQTPGQSEAERKAYAFELLERTLWKGESE